jgi:hypothetical protein
MESRIAEDDRPHAILARRRAGPRRRDGKRGHENSRPEGRLSCVDARRKDQRE